MSLLADLIGCYEWDELIPEPTGGGRQDLTGSYLTSGAGLGGGGGPPTRVPGFGVFNNNALLFNNDAGSALRTGITEPLTEFTVAVWFKVLGTVPLTNAQRLVDRDYTTGFWMGSAVGDVSGLSWGGGLNNNVNFATYSNTGIYLTLSVGWHQLVSRFTAAPGGGGRHTISADGMKQSIIIGVGAGPNSTAAIRIGEDVTGAGQNHDTPISQTCIWRRPLTDSEIAEHYNNGQGVRYPFGVRRMGRPLGSRIIMP